MDLPQRRKIEILVAILLGLFLAALDQTIVGTALPRIVSDLRGNELYTWVVTISCSRAPSRPHLRKAFRPVRAT